MTVNLAIILILVFVVLYALLIEIYSILFRLTGMTKSKSTFQAISLLTCAGYTTNEAELVVSNKQRRRIAIAGMITGYSFSVIIISLIINFINLIRTDRQDDTIIVALICVSVLFGLIILSRIPFIKKLDEKIITSIAKLIFLRNKTKNTFMVVDYEGKYCILDIHLAFVPDDFKDKTLAECELRPKYNINIIMIKRNGKVIRVDKDSVMQKGDNIILYGEMHKIKKAFNFDEKIKVVEETKDNNIKVFENYGEDAVCEIEIKDIPIELKDKDLVNEDLLEVYNIWLLSIKRGNKQIDISKNVILELNDIVSLYGNYKNILHLFGTKKEEAND